MRGFEQQVVAQNSVGSHSLLFEQSALFVQKTSAAQVGFPLPCAGLTQNAALSTPSGQVKLQNVEGHTPSGILVWLHICWGALGWSA